MRGHIHAQGAPELPDTLLKICGRGHLALNVHLPWPSHSWGSGINAGLLPWNKYTFACVYACLCSGNGRLSHQLEISAGQSCGGMSGMQIRSLVHRSKGAGGGGWLKVVKGEVKAKGEDKEEGS